MSERVTTLRYVRMPLADDAVRLGWLPLPGLIGTHHGSWSVLMEWLCECPAPFPVSIQMQERA
jgi:hypothetical protein